jgi:hypothetical protein
MAVRDLKLINYHRSEKCVIFFFLYRTNEKIIES